MTATARSITPDASKQDFRVADLARPIYQKTAAYGHFGRKEAEFSWERTDKAEVLAADARRAVRARARTA